MALIGVHSIVVPGKKNGKSLILILMFQVEERKEALPERTELSGFCCCLVYRLLSDTAFRWVLYILESTWKLSLLWELQLFGLCQATGFVGRAQWGLYQWESLGHDPACGRVRAAVLPQEKWCERVQLCHNSIPPSYHCIGFYSI